MYMYICMEANFEMHVFCYMGLHTCYMYLHSKAGTIHVQYLSTVSICIMLFLS